MFDAEVRFQRPPLTLAVAFSPRSLKQPHHDGLDITRIVSVQQRPAANLEWAAPRHNDRGRRGWGVVGNGNWTAEYHDQNCTTIIITDQLRHDERERGINKSALILS